MSTTHHQVVGKCNNSAACEFKDENTFGRETLFFRVKWFPCSWVWGSVCKSCRQKARRTVARGRFALQKVNKKQTAGTHELPRRDPSSAAILQFSFWIHRLNLLLTDWSQVIPLYRRYTEIRAADHSRCISSKKNPASAGCVCVCHICIDVKLPFFCFTLRQGARNPSLSVLANEDQTVWGWKRTCNILHDGTWLTREPPCRFLNNLFYMFLHGRRQHRRRCILVAGNLRRRHRRWHYFWLLNFSILILFFLMSIQDMVIIQENFHYS